MIQAVLLMATVLGASVYYWNHNRELALENYTNGNDILLKTVDFHPILWNKCQWPNLDKNEEDIRKFLRKKIRPECVSKIRTKFEGTTLLVMGPAQNSEKIRCRILDLKSLAQDDVAFDEPKNVTGAFGEFILECLEAETGAVVERKTFWNAERAEHAVDATAMNPSISVLYLKSMSRSHFLRNFPEFQKILKNYGMHDFQMFNKMSENVSENVWNTFNSENNGRNIADFMKNRFCSIFSNDERSGIWAKSDFQIPRFQTSLDKDTCVNSDPHQKSLAWLKLWADFELANSGKCHFSQIFVDNFIDHGDFRMDQLLSETFRKFAENRVLNNTIILILSAEGIPIGEFGNSYTGKVEERNAVLFLSVPWKLQKHRKDHSFHLDKNQNSLITHRDVFETLESFSKTSDDQQIIELTPEEWKQRNRENRGISLWQTLHSTKNNCTISKIPAQNCLCMEPQLEIEAAYNKTNEMLDRLTYKMSNDAISGSDCLSNIEIDPKWNYTAVWNLNGEILQGAQEYVQFLTVRNMAYDVANSNRNRHFSTLGQFKQYIYSDPYRIEAAYPYCLANHAFHCNAGFLHRFCEMCHNHLLLS
ncbi:unnamed protein product [Caenorhabditis angaria]|uniref:Uncharacterized protein n=1 Tax=Caenorhabditis angaria TaxID=860376 RepID=A0A9P1N3T9_9PELO|nr:unnamed protein product [Caenorhabditis angaria]